MIKGWFAPGTGLPLVKARVWLGESGVRIDVDCLVDTTIPRSSLSTADLPAVLGRDVLERTVMVYDPRGGNLLVEVLDGDL